MEKFETKNNELKEARKEHKELSLKYLDLIEIEQQLKQDPHDPHRKTIEKDIDDLNKRMDEKEKKILEIETKLGRR